MTGSKSHEFPYDVCIVGGAGHIGLPLGLALAQKGQRVLLYDLNESAIALIKSGKMPFLEDDADPVLAEVLDRKLLFVSSAGESVGKARFVVVTVGTPIDEYMSPDLGALPRTIGKFHGHLRPETTLIIRSTVFPGTCRQVLHSLGKGEWKVAYCPERIAQGRAIRELAELPQIVSGTSPAACQEAAELFGLIGPRIIEVSVEEAELVKLFSNAWRYIKFATANQFYVMAHGLGVDYNRVLEAMTAGYSRNTGLPTAGLAAGPCLMKDTMQLCAASPGGFSLGQAAAAVNEGMPAFLVEQVRMRGDVRGTSVGILGMAFKGDIDDIRDSLAFKVRKLLAFQGANVVCSDEYVSDPSFVSKEALFEACKIVVVGAPHSAYRQLAVPDGVELIDLWNSVGTAAAKQPHSGT